MMPCPECGQRTRVVDSRVTVTYVRRRRQCDCGFAGSTIEQWAPIRKGHPVRKVLDMQRSAMREQAGKIRAALDDLDDSIKVQASD